MNSKLEEAQEHRRQAEKYLKTSLFRWRPEYESAADEYNQAAQAYRIYRDVKSAKKCFLKASDNYKKVNALFHAAKALDNAMLVSKEKSTPNELFNLASEAANLYQQHGSIDSAAVVLDRAARFLEARAPQIAVQLYMQAAEVTAGDSNQSSGEYLAKTSRLLVRLKRYDDAVEYITREILFYQDVHYMAPVGRLTVVIILVHLARGDVVAAWKAYEEWGTSCESTEAQTLVTLLQAFDDEDAETASKALKSPFIRSMDVDYARLAELIQLPQGTKVVTTGGDISAQASSSSAQAKLGSHSEQHVVAPCEAAPCMIKPKESIKEPNLDEIHEDEMELC